jgi:3-keto steroid reductase
VSQSDNLSYPYITSLFLNAGMGAFIGVDWGKALLQMACSPVDAVTHPNYKLQRVGVKTSDGERGLIWSVNVFANYLLVCERGPSVTNRQAKELVGHLRQSPESLICPPRIIYTSSSISDGSYLPEDPLSDYQLLTVPHSYEASKYIADLVFSDLDQSLGNSVNDKPVRCLLADPGIAATNVFSAGLNFVSSFFMMLAFYFVSSHLMRLAMLTTYRHGYMARASTTSVQKTPHLAFSICP